MGKKQFCFQEYPNLTFDQGGFLESNINENFNIIISTCALQHCLNAEQAIMNIYDLLAPEGKALIMVPALANTAWKNARKAIQTSEKWKQYWSKIIPRNFFGVEEYKELFNRSPFKIQRIEFVPTRDPFVDRDELLNFLLGCITPAVPRELSKEFFNEIIDEYLRLQPDALSTDSVIEVRFGRIEIEVLK